MHVLLLSSSQRHILNSLSPLANTLESLSSLSPPSLRLLHWALSPKHFSLRYLTTAEVSRCEYCCYCCWCYLFDEDCNVTN